MSKKRFTSKTYLKVLIVVGLLAVIGGGAGTFASFNAEVTNSGNTFANGTLFLHATPNGGTTCTSESDTINNAGSDTCTLLFSNAALANGVASTATLKLHNSGTLNATDITFKVASCSVTNNSGSTGSSVVFGTAPTCTNLRLAVQETSDSLFATNAYCAYGTDAAGVCSIDLGHNLATAASFQTLKTTGAINATLATGADRYYVIEIDPSVASDNSLQNRLVTFGLTWHIDS